MTRRTALKNVIEKISSEEGMEAEVVILRQLLDETYDRPKWTKERIWDAIEQSVEDHEGRPLSKQERLQRGMPSYEILKRKLGMTFIQAYALISHPSEQFISIRGYPSRTQEEWLSLFRDEYFRIKEEIGCELTIRLFAEHKSSYCPEFQALSKALLNYVYWNGLLDMAGIIRRKNTGRNGYITHVELSSPSLTAAIEARKKLETLMAEHPLV